MKLLVIAAFILFLSSCTSSINFNAPVYKTIPDGNDGTKVVDGDGLLYFEPVPYLSHSINKKCVETIKVVILPGKKKRLEFNSGYGKSDLKVELGNGIITSVNSVSDSKSSELLTAIAAVKGAFTTQAESSGCNEISNLYSIKKDGSIDLTNIVDLLKDRTE